MSRGRQRGPYRTLRAQGRTPIFGQRQGQDQRGGGIEMQDRGRIEHIGDGADADQRQGNPGAGDQRDRPAGAQRFERLGRPAGDHFLGPVAQDRGLLAEIGADGEDRRQRQAEGEIAIFDHAHQPGENDIHPIGQPGRRHLDEKRHQRLRQARTEEAPQVRTRVVIHGAGTMPPLFLEGLTGPSTIPSRGRTLAPADLSWLRGPWQWMP